MKKVLVSVIWVILLFIFMSMFCIGSLAFASGIKTISGVIAGMNIVNASKSFLVFYSSVCIVGGTVASFVGCYLFMNACSYIRTGKGLKSKKESLEAPPAYIIEKK